MRTCSRCGEGKPITEFPERVLGSGRRHGHCRPCKAAYQKAWYDKNKERHKANVAVIRKETIRRNREIIAAAKAKPCADCGVSFSPYVMDFDHVRGRKRGTIASWYASVSEKALCAEIAKCDVVCANCHRERTYGTDRIASHRRGPRSPGGGAHTQCGGARNLCGGGAPGRT